MTTGIVVGSILLAADEQLGVEQLAIGAGADLVDRGGVKVNEDGSRNMFAVARLSEKGLERTTLADVLDIRVGATISSEAMLKEVTTVLGLAQSNVSIRKR